MNTPNLTGWIGDLLSSPDPFVAQIAGYVEQVKTQYDSQMLSDSEYQELVTDALDLRRIDEIAGDLEQTIYLQEVFSRLAQYAGILKAFI